MTLGSSDWLSLILMALTMADPCVKKMRESQYINIQDFKSLVMVGISLTLDLISRFKSQKVKRVKRMGESQYINIQDFTLAKELGNGRHIIDTGPYIDGGLDCGNLTSRHRNIIKNEE